MGLCLQIFKDSSAQLQKQRRRNIPKSFDGIVKESFRHSPGGKQAAKLRQSRKVTISGRIKHLDKAVGKSREDRQTSEAQSGLGRLAVPALAAIARTAKVLGKTKAPSKAELFERLKIKPGPVAKPKLAHRALGRLKRRPIVEPQVGIEVRSGVHEAPGRTQTSRIIASRLHEREDFAKSLLSDQSVSTSRPWGQWAKILLLGDSAEPLRR